MDTNNKCLMKTRFITFLLLFGMNLGAFAQSPYQPAEENLKAGYGNAPIPNLLKHFARARSTLEAMAN